VHSEIPLRSGLGSSAAATVAGLRLRELVDGRRPGAEILSAASKIEGHPDNVAPSLFGGVTSCCAMADGTIRVARWPWPRAWRIVVATPALELPTPLSRRAIPRRLPVGDAVFNLQRAGPAPRRAPSRLMRTISGRRSAIAFTSRIGSGCAGVAQAAVGAAC
jgi:homoserine kinase